jgi:hypothetical protein
MPERSLKYEKLFTDDIQDPIERIKRVENAVMDLRHDFEAVLPSIIRLVAVEKDIQQLTEQLGTLLPNEPQNAVVSDAGTLAPPEGVGTPASVPGAGSPGLPANTAPVAIQAAPPPSAVSPPETVAMAAAPPATPTQPPQYAAPVPPMEAPPQQVPKTASPAAFAPPETATPPPTQPPPAPVPIQPPQNTGWQTAKPVQNMPAPVMTLPASSVPAAKTPASASSGGGTKVERLRLGAQPNGKTRLVLDLTGKAAYHFDIDNEEHILIVELPKAGWNAETRKTVSGNAFISSWETQKIDGGGTRLIVTLRKGAKIGYDALLPPAGGSGYRVVLDLQAAG